jgi:hypothetical protein
MSTSVQDLACWIAARKAQLDRALRSDLIKLEVQYGRKLLTEAIALADRAETRERLSTSAARCSGRAGNDDGVFKKCQQKQ